MKSTYRIQKDITGVFLNGGFMLVRKSFLFLSLIAFAMQSHTMSHSQLLPLVRPLFNAFKADVTVLAKKGFKQICNDSVLRTQLGLGTALTGLGYMSYYLYWHDSQLGKINTLSSLLDIVSQAKENYNVATYLPNIEVKGFSRDIQDKFELFKAIQTDKTARKIEIAETYAIAISQLEKAIKSELKILHERLNSYRFKTLFGAITSYCSFIAAAMA